MRVTPEVVEMIARARFDRTIVHHVRSNRVSFEQLDADIADAYRNEVRDFLLDVDAAGLEVEIKY